MTDAAFDQWAVVVFVEDGAWQVAQLPPSTGDDLASVVSAVRGQVGDAFSLVNVADEFFVVVRQRGGRLRYLLSDVSASTEWELAAQVMEALDLDVPADEELDQVWPAGDLGVFEDVGLEEMELGDILSDVDAYADEMLSTLARRLGFAEEYERAVDALV